jgi:hypothetical protein
VSEWDFSPPLPQSLFTSLFVAYVFGEERVEEGGGKTGVENQLHQWIDQVLDD